QDERDVGARRRLERTELRVVLDALPLLALAAQARRVDELERALAATDDRVDRVARRSRHLRHDRPLLPHEAVVERRLADVRPTEDRHANRIVVERPRRLTGQELEDLVQQVTRVRAMQPGDGERLAEPEAM